MFVYCTVIWLPRTLSTMDLNMGFYMPRPTYLLSLVRAAAAASAAALFHLVVAAVAPCGLDGRPGGLRRRLGVPHGQQDVLGRRALRQLLVGPRPRPLLAADSHLESKQEPVKFRAYTEDQISLRLGWARNSRNLSQINWPRRVYLLPETFSGDDLQCTSTALVQKHV